MCKLLYGPVWWLLQETLPFPDTEILKINSQYIHHVWLIDELVPIHRASASWSHQEQCWKKNRSGVLREVLIEDQWVVGEGRSLRGHGSLWGKDLRKNTWGAGSGLLVCISYTAEREWLTPSILYFCLNNQRVTFCVGCHKALLCLL